MIVKFLGNALKHKSKRVEVSEFDKSLKFCSPYNFIAIFNLYSELILTKLLAVVNIDLKDNFLIELCSVRN